MGCAVPTPLKAELLKTLTSLCRTPDIALLVWQNMESSQLIHTLATPLEATPTGHAPLSSGLGAELETVEARNEEYPMTRAFLALLDVLTEGGVPRLLGAGQRVPGIEPYLAFVRDAIFLR